MGRVVSDLACSPSDCGRGSGSHSTWANYDLAGNIHSLTYPDGRVVSQAWDAAGRLSTITDATPGGTGTQYYAAQYWPSGGAQNIDYANGAAQSLTINSRL